jgi:hypothetical protein
MSCGMLRRVVHSKFTSVSKAVSITIIRALISMIMEEISISETSVNFYQVTPGSFPRKPF